MSVDVEGEGGNLTQQRYQRLGLGLLNDIEGSCTSRRQSLVV